MIRVKKEQYEEGYEVYSRRIEDNLYGGYLRMYSPVDDDY